MSIMGYNAGRTVASPSDSISQQCAPGPGIYHLFRASHAALPRTHHEEEQPPTTAKEEPGEHPAMR